MRWACRTLGAALVWRAGRSQTATSSILLARAVEAARVSRNSPRAIGSSRTAHSSRHVVPGQVPGAGDGPAGDQVGYRGQVPVDGQFRGGLQ